MGLLLVVLLVGSGSWGLTESSEARYAEVGREMYLSSDYLHPTLLGIYHYHKPPITYQLTALSYNIFGVNEFAARFFLSVALLLQIWLVYKIGQLLFKNEKKAVASSLIYLSFPLVLIAARNLTTDAFLTTFILWAIYFWLLRKTGRSVWFLYGFYILLGIAGLTKGPVTILPPVIFILIWKIINKENLKINRHSLIGAFIFLAVSSSWFIAIFIDKPVLFEHFVQDEIVKRSLGAEKFHRNEPFWYYFLFAPLLGMPWLIFIAIDVWRNFRYIKEEGKMELILLWSSLLLLFIFSLFSSKLVLYILPIYPFMALLGGSLVARVSFLKLQVYSVIYAALFLILFTGLLYISFSTKFEFNFWYALTLCAIIAAMVYYFLKKKNSGFFRPVYMGVGFSLILLTTYTLFAAQNDDKINSIKALSSFIQNEKQDQINNVILFDYLLPSAAFYFSEPVITVSDHYYNAQRETEFEMDSLYKQNYIDLRQQGEVQRFVELLKQKNNVLILRKKKVFPDSLQYLLKNFSDMTEMGKWKVYY